MAKNDKEKMKHIWRKALSAINLGWEMALPIFAGVLLGNYLDKLTDSRFNLTISFLVGGIILSYYNLVRHIQKLNQIDTNNHDDPDQ